MDPTRIVMLLAGTVVAIGAIFSFWGAQLVQTRLNATANQTSGEICVGALFRLYPDSSHYDSNKKELLLILENQRKVDLELKTLYLFYTNKEMKTFDLNKPLQGNMLISVPVENVDAGFDSGTIKTNCPEVSLDFKYSDVA
jgi:hypothetical protein